MMGWLEVGVAGAAAIGSLIAWRVVYLDGRRARRARARASRRRGYIA